MSSTDAQRLALLLAEARRTLRLLSPPAAGTTGSAHTAIDSEHADRLPALRATLTEAQALGAWMTPAQRRAFDAMLDTFARIELTSGAQSSDRAPHHPAAEITQRGGSNSHPTPAQQSLHDVALKNTSSLRAAAEDLEENVRRARDINSMLITSSEMLESTSTEHRTSGAGATQSALSLTRRLRLQLSMDRILLWVACAAFGLVCIYILQKRARLWWWRWFGWLYRWLSDRLFQATLGAEIGAAAGGAGGGNVTPGAHAMFRDWPAEL
ncbi:hypothetical protein H696_04494 [Fonticula alba]|uniref:Uncharacterized protein n=1 Tax=Fonticula alba TaxID=691883 RepID=A0A058Z474_FONAL|nr:hypothetical protein H696_04494 [Fonticula alba]KCV69079.1 hypothetical protein H696_04494 [Fonticula alba]|eukprot:XP_009496650.1 hypothetical protein H696_04494 [Fonticula alba]